MPSPPIQLAPRPIHDLAVLALQGLPPEGRCSTIQWCAREALEWLSQDASNGLNALNGEAIASALSNLQGWRGPLARVVKAELSAYLER